VDASILKAINAERRARRAVIALTNLADGSSQLIREGEPIASEFRDAVEAAFRTGKSGTIDVNGQSWFLNAHLPPPRIVVIGAVHISQALAPMAKIAGFDVEIVDPRTAFATEERFPNVALYPEWPEDYLKRRPLDTFAAVAAVTHDPKVDDLPLQAALETGCFYVGALGSRKTHAKRVERLREAGLSDEQISRIHAPIGLDIAAASPAEIAVAILGDIIKALRTRGLAPVQMELAE